MDARTLSEVMGGSLPLERYEALLPTFENAMRVAGCTNRLRAAMWCAQIGHESVGLRYMEEIASGTAYEWRRDLGNTQPGDGARFKGRGPIQLTGRANYRAFTAWVHDKKLGSFDFEAEPWRLSEPHWGFLAATYYWTVARSDINMLCDRGDLETVTRRINGGLNGLQDRRQRYQRALSMGDRILPKQGGAIIAKPWVEKILPYSRNRVAQETYYNCGPATVETIVQSATGRWFSESDLGRKLGTYQGGTDWIGQFPKVLNGLIPGADYGFREMPNDPATSTQRDQLWKDIINSINAGHGVVANIVSPPSNRPRGVRGSMSPAYPDKGTIYHYIAVMGYGYDDYQRAVWIADSGFSPFGYWLSFDQLATLIPPKGYAYSKAPAKTTGGLNLSNTDQKRIELVLDQLAGPGKNQDGLPTFTGWKLEDLVGAARHNLEAGMGLTIPQLMALQLDGQTRQTEAINQLVAATTNLAKAINGGK